MTTSHFRSTWQQPSTESELQAKVISWFRSKYECVTPLPILIAYNANSHNRFKGSQNRLQGVTAGVPDLQFIYNNKVVFIELKNPKKTGVVSEVQRRFHIQLRDNGIDVYVISSLEEVQKLLDSFFEQMTK